MAMMLPDELAWLLEMLGFDWPTANEDHMMQCAQTWRDFGAQVGDIQAAAMQSAGNVTSENYGESIDAFVEKWDNFAGGSGYLDDARQAAEVIAGVFDVAAMLIIGMKIAVIVQLIVLAIQIAVAAATAVVTFGLSGVASAAMTQVSRIAIRKILKEAAQALLEAALEAVKEPFVSALEEMSKDLVAQTVNQNFGAQDGYNLGRTADAGKTAVKDGFDNFGSTLGESLRDGAGGRAGHHARSGLDSAAGNSSSSSSNSDSSSSDSSSSSSSSSSSDSSSGGGDGGSGGSGSTGPSSSTGSSGADSGSSSPGSSSSGSGSTGTGGSPSSGGGPSHSAGGAGANSGAAVGGHASDGTGVAAHANVGTDGASASVSATTPGADRPLTPFDAGYNDQPQASTPDVSNSGGTPDASAPTHHQGNDHATPAAASIDHGAPDTSSAVPHARVDADVNTPTATPTPDPAPSTQHDPVAQGINTATESAAPAHDGNGPLSQSPAHDPSTTTDPRTQAQQPTTPTTPAGTPTPTDTSSPTTHTPGTPGTPGSIPGAATHTGTSATTGTGSDTTSHARTSNPTFHSQSVSATETHTTPSRPAHTPTPTNTDPNQSTPAPNQAPHTGPAPATATPTPNATTPSPGPTRQSPPQTTPTTPTTPNPRTTPPRTDAPRTDTPRTDIPRRQPPHPAPTQPSTPSPNIPSQPSPATPQRPTPTETHNPSAHQAPTPTPAGVYAVPTPAANPGPNNNPNSQNHGSNPPGTPPSATPTPSQPAPLSQGQSLQQIRDSLNHAPYGLLPPDPADQQALVNAVPRNPDGTPQRHPDPFGQWAQLQNDGGFQQPGRSNNCLDNARAALSTWFGNPQVAAPRTPDTNPDGSLDRMSPERDSYNNLDSWAGRPQIWAGADHPNPYARIAQHLQEAGPGSAAVVGVQWPGGGGHAFNVYNHNGQIVWADHQTGEISPNPIHTGAAGVRYVPFDANGQTIDAPWEKKQDTESTADADADADAGVDSNSESSSAQTSSNPEHSGPAASYGALPDQSDQEHSPQDQQQEGDHSRRDLDPTRADRNGGLVPEGRGDLQQGVAPDPIQGDLRDSHDVYRTDLDTVHQTLRDWADPDKHPEAPLAGLLEEAAARRQRYEEAMEPIETPRRALQDAIAEERAIERQIKEHLKNGATDQADALKDGPLAEAATRREQAQNAYDEAVDNHRGTPVPPTAFTHAELQAALGDRFASMNDGERYAVIAAIARMSNSFHADNAVGNSPERPPDGHSPYEGSTKGTGDNQVTNPAVNDYESSAARRRNEAAPDLPPKYRADSDSKKAFADLRRVFAESVADDLSSVKRRRIKDLLEDALESGNGPDLTGKNYAVVEVVDAAGNSTYVVDSSVPPGADGVSPLHSESHILNWIDTVNGETAPGAEPKYTIAGLYTEREPCGSKELNTGYAECSRTIAQHESMNGVPVYYSTTYRHAGTEEKNRMDEELADHLAVVAETWIRVRTQMVGQ